MLLELAAEGHFDAFQRLQGFRVTVVIQDLGDSLHVGVEGLLLFRCHSGDLERDWLYPHRFPPSLTNSSYSLEH